MLSFCSATPGTDPTLQDFSQAVNTIHTIETFTRYWQK